jgi:hypothetical protein
MTSEKVNLLLTRVTDNYESFKYSLRGVSRTKIFEMAERIAAVKEVYRLLTKDYAWDEEDEVGFFLLFRDPLTIVADAWENRDQTQDFDDVMYGLCDDDEIIAQYPLLEGSYADIVYVGAPGGQRILNESEI